MTRSSNFAIVILCAMFWPPISAPAQELAHPANPGSLMRPEIYLDLSQYPRNKPREVKRLPWPLVITITAADTNNNAVTGPITMTTYEEFTGGSFKRQSASIKPPIQADTNAVDSGQPGPETYAGVFELFQGIAVQMEEMDFAVQVFADGANSLRLRCFARVHVKSGTSTQSFEALSTIECRPGREHLLAQFPGVTLRIRATWSRESPYLSE